MTFVITRAGYGDPLRPHLRTWHNRAVTPNEYLDGVPAERRALVDAVRATVLANLPEGFEETIEFGMLGYVIPLDRYPDTYNGRPLQVAALANQKQYVSLYLMGVYADEAERQWFTDAWTATGTKLNMGKACVRFKRLDQVPLDVVGEAIARVSVIDMIAAYERSRR